MCYFGGHGENAFKVAWRKEEKPQSPLPRPTQGYKFETTLRNFYIPKL